MHYHLDHTWDGQPAPVAMSFELRREATALVLEVEGPLTQVPPPTAAPGRLWGLWEHDVFELFVAGPGNQYVELELGPHGHYLALRLDAVRHIADDALSLVCDWYPANPGCWRARARLAAEDLPEGHHRFNAYAILGPRPREHLALFPLAGAAPDFHQLESFRPIPL